MSLNFFFFRSFFSSVVGFPLYTEIFYIISQWSCSASGPLWEMPDLNPEPLPQKSGALPMSQHISNETPHLQWATTSSMSHHILKIWSQSWIIVADQSASFLKFENISDLTTFRHGCGSISCPICIIIFCTGSASTGYECGSEPMITKNFFVIGNHRWAPLLQCGEIIIFETDPYPGSEKIGCGSGSRLNRILYQETHKNL